MMNPNKYLFSLFILMLMFSMSCARRWYSYEATSATTRISPTHDEKMDTSLDSLLQPYRLEFAHKMSDTLAYNPKTLYKNGKPGMLGCWVTDALMWYADSVLHSSADIALCNSGGIRIASLDEGLVTNKNIYELMPFDNEIVLLDVDSSIMDSLAPHVYHGWPVSSGYSYFLDTSQHPHWQIKKKSTSNKFRIVLSDFLANGGDKLNFLKPIPQDRPFKLFRDILIEYALHQKTIYIPKRNTQTH